MTAFQASPPSQPVLFNPHLKQVSSTAATDTVNVFFFFNFNVLIGSVCAHKIIFLN